MNEGLNDSLKKTRQENLEMKTMANQKAANDCSFSKEDKDLSFNDGVRQQVVSRSH